MKIRKTQIKEIIDSLGFKQIDSNKDIFYKEYDYHNKYLIKIDFNQEKIDYGTKIEIGDLTTSNFDNSENFVVLECVNRVLEKGYAPDKLSLEHKWPMGKKEKGKLDILVLDKENKAYLMIECKTWGDEYDREKKKMQRDGGQLFSYYQQDKAAQYLCLYTSRVIDGKIEFSNEIVKVNEVWRELTNQKEIFDHWNKNFKDNGIFEDWANAYDIEIKALTRRGLKELTEEDSGRIFNQFAEILRHNVVSDKPNAFNKIFNLFLCKIVDEDRKPTEELKFQWLDTDTDEDLQKRLSDLYKQGMKEYLTKEVTDYNDGEIEQKLYALDSTVRDQIRDMFTRVRLHKNNEFAFKEVFDEKSFKENAVVVREVVELLQPYQIRYGHKQQFLGDFFELLLSTGIKQEAGQFFTPVPIAKFIISSLPIRELISRKIENDETHFLPYIIDFAAGSGHFLTEAMDEVQNIIQDINEQKQKPSVKRNLSGWKINPFDWAYDYVYGIEADYRLVKTAKVSCFLNGDGLANVIHADGLDHFQKSIDYKGKLKEISKDNPKDNGAFDILIANPPYSVSAFKNTLKHGEASFELFKRLTYESSEIECLFIERAKQLLRSGGWAGIILPSSILSNSGIYTDAREIILKYFDIKAIAEFGSNTFMATGTNTVTLFLERKANNDWKKIETVIKNFFNKPKEDIVNGIRNAFSKYVAEVFEGLELKDYITLINKEPNLAILKHELFTEYKAWFDDLAEIKNLKIKKAFKNKTQDEQQAELERRFYEQVFARERDKMLYFFLTYPQQTVLIKVGEKQAEKNFIGYEFSSRRGHEGIKMYRDENGKPITKLYDDENHLNEEKANSYVYQAFLGRQKEIAESLKENLSSFNLNDLINFKTLDFEKVISINAKKRVKLVSIWPITKLSMLAKNIINGSTPLKSNNTYWLKKEIPWITVPDFPERSLYVSETSQHVSQKAVDDKKVKLIPENSILVSCTATIGKVCINKIKLTTNQQINSIICDTDKVIVEYLAYYLRFNAYKLAYLTNNPGVLHVNQQMLNSFPVPLPPKAVQEKIISEIEDVERSEKEERDKLRNLNNQLNNIFLNLNYKNDRLGNIADFKNGLNYNEKSSGDLVTIVGVKDFLEDFSPNLDKLVDVRIDGKLTDSYKLKEGDILVVRSNGSANLVGRFIYINKLKKDTSYSGFTIRIRSNSPKVNSKYLCYCLRTETVRSAITTDPKGANIKSVNQTMLSTIQVPIPPINVQLKIVAKAERLEKQIAQIEAKLSTKDEKKEQIIKKYIE
ncbi:restriction endonuclease subunit S [Alkaliphilus peptidifermentans]|uniref:Type I restriction enzyme M protein n=1 Tax=Alkaliphilus peptidifermentans DSM 18978 TaxID=1120976 RepID=A0A1G5JHN9_9FIRM|nr:restriction endonuclease subunit S [Alkaliphilus peptidifermentans]SCY87684.1 type I restriction enzyme M protein [Alkaliphilus peptidifermentans DSM 18978]